MRPLPVQPGLGTKASELHKPDTFSDVWTARQHKQRETGGGKQLTN